MKQTILSTVLALHLMGLSGCSTPAEPPPALPLTMAGEFHKRSAEILKSGGLAVVGISKSKSLNLAINRAKTDGRIKLADLLKLKTDAHQNELSKDSAQAIITDHIQGLIAKELNHEITNGIVTAYALMELDPNILNQKTKPHQTRPAK